VRSLLLKMSRKLRFGRWLICPDSSSIPSASCFSFDGWAVSPVGRRKNARMANPVRTSMTMIIAMMYWNRFIVCLFSFLVAIVCFSVYVILKIRSLTLRRAVLRFIILQHALLRYVIQGDADYPYGRAKMGG